MVSIGIENMKRILTKNPKSLIFAQYVDALRLESSTDKQKLDEALQVANKGVEINPGFSTGKLVRGRVLLEKGDLASAKIDFEAVTEQDPFCLTAHKLLIETVGKLSVPFDTEICVKILKSLDPAAIAAQPAAIKVPETPQIASSSAPPSTKAQIALAAALDDIVEEDEKQEIETETRLLKAVNSIIESVVPLSPPVLPDVAPIFNKDLPPVASAEPKPEPEPEPAPEPKSEPEASSSNLDDILKEQLADKPVDNLPDLTGTMDSLLSTAEVHEAPKEVPLDSALEAPLAESHGEINIDSILQEQLADKVETPDLTGDLDALLATAQPAEPAPAPTSEPEPVQHEAAAPNLDDILKEQLADKVETPDLTGDLDALLATAQPAEPAPEPEPVQHESVAPNLDDILKEQLADKVETPDLTGDLDALLATAQPAEPTPEPAPVQHESAAPNLDDILKEQLADKVETPDLTGDLDALLATAQPAEPAPEPAPVQHESTAPNLDDILKEQLADKVETPDLTGDLDALLATAQPAEPTLEPEPVQHESAAPNLDDILKEQLADKVETPDLTGDLDKLLATAQPAEPAAINEDEVELRPYVPKKSAPSIEDIFKEQLADKPVGDIPDLTDDMDMLLATETLAEHYMDQKLPKKAVAVYKELLSRDPNNDELKAKLDIAETQIV